MKRLMAITFALLFCLALSAGTASAVSGSLWDQEKMGTDDGWSPNPDLMEVEGQDDPSAASRESWQNWKYQYGYDSWTGVYAGDDGWEYQTGGDHPPALAVEADIEMYCSEWVQDYNIYFHLGNLYSATASNKTAYCNGGFTSNNGMYVGMEIGEGKDVELATGIITDGMVSLHDTWRAQDNSMDVQIQLDQGAGAAGPDAYGEGAHGTIIDALWWLIDSGNPGTHTYTWVVTILPETDQPDGDYWFDPAIISAPVL
jgi:hypothetical protein